MPKKSKIERAHTEGDAAVLSRWAAKAMKMPAHMSHAHLIAGSCTHCGFDIGDDTYCTRFATDLTSVAEFEDARMPEGCRRRISAANSVILVWYGVARELPKFLDANEAFNRCAAVLWAIADAEK